MPMSLKWTVLKATIQVFRQLELKLDQFAIESSGEVAVKWFRQRSKLLLDQDSFSLYLLSDMRQTKNLRQC